VDTDLAYCDPVDCSGGLSVASSVESEPLVVGCPDGDGSCSGPHGVGVSGFEAGDVGGFTDEFGGGCRIQDRWQKARVEVDGMQRPGPIDRDHQMKLAR
jgi:hypothetical protein